MAFSSAYTAEPVNIGSGQTMEAMSFDSLNAETWEDGLKVGCFAKIDTGSLDNMDGSDTPVVAGVVRRLASNPIEDDGTLTKLAGRPVDVSYVRNGYVAVEVKTGDTPAMFGTVYADNTTALEYGKATTTALDNIDIGAEFIKEIKAGVWLIRIK